MTWYDVNGTETLNQTEAVSSMYYITLSRLISSLSASSISVVKTTTKATITVDLPAAVQESALPFTGYYRIKCVDPQGYESFSDDLAYN